MKNFLLALLALALVVPASLVAGCHASNPTTSTIAGFVFATQPAGAVAGTPFETQPVVYVEDAHGQVITGYAGTVALGITPGAGASGAILSGGTTVNAVAGVASFSDLSIDTAGSGYTLIVLDNSATPAVSAPFDVAAVVSVDNSLAVVQNIFFPTEGDYYYLYVVIKPGGLAKPDTDYTVTLYLKGAYRASQTISWSAAIIDTAVSTMPFALTAAEFQQYEGLPNLRSVFSVQITA